MTEVYWWVALGYPPFDMGKNGFPRTGQVVKHYRELKKDHNGKPYTQSALAHVLRISDQCMRDIEIRDLAMDYDRRHFLSEILNIPPKLLGIITLEEIRKLVEIEQKANNAGTIISTPTRTGAKLIVDTKEYDDHLRYLCLTHKGSSAHITEKDTLLRIDTLYHELPHVSIEEQTQIRKLLCGHHVFVADLLRDQQLYDDSMYHIEKAVSLARQLQNADEIVVALYNKAILFDDSGRIEEVIHNYEKAKKYEKKIPYNMQGTILLNLGRARAKTAKTEKERHEALALVDIVGNIVRSNQKEDDPYLLKLDLERYHLTKSATLLAIGKNQDAIDELMLVHTEFKYPRRQAYKDTLLAQAYINKGQYGYGTSMAESALDIARQVNSYTNIGRVMKIYQQLQKSPYKDSPDVARLGYLLRTNLSVIPH